jgi:hypothetical protein
MKKQNLSSDKVRNMMMTGVFKRELTFRNLESVKEFLQVEVGYELDSEGMSVRPCNGAIMFEEEFIYKGKAYGMIHLTFKNELVLIGSQGGLKIKWKNILGRINSRHEENGKTYDTKTAKFIKRSVVAIKEEPFDAVFLDFYQTDQGEYFTHIVNVMMKYIADVNVKNGTLSKKDARYVTMIKPVPNEIIIKDYGSLENAQKMFDDIAPQLDSTLFDVLGDPCEVCNVC